MKLKRLIKNLKVIKTIGNLDVDIKEIKANSNHVTKDCLFICITCRDFDGHKYLKQAEQYGAVAVIHGEGAELCQAAPLVYGCLQYYLQLYPF